MYKHTANYKGVKKTQRSDMQITADIMQTHDL